MAAGDPDYRPFFYARYVSAFKSRLPVAPNYQFSDSKLIPLIKDWVRPIDRALPCVDLGCGDGNMLHALRTLGFQNISGVDVSAEQVALAQKVCANVRCGDLMTELAAYPDNHFGVITVFDVIEHLRKAEILQLMERAISKLRPGGIIVFHCPNGDSPWAQGVFASDFTHETLLAPASAANLCAVFGLTRFEAREHLGVSASLKGAVRSVLWAVIRAGIKCRSVIETGSAGSGVYTRNFAFKAQRPE